MHDTVVYIFVVLGIIKCRQEGLWVEETPFEALGTILAEHSVFTEAPRKARESAMLQVYMCSYMCIYIVHSMQHYL